MHMVLSPGCVKGTFFYVFYVCWGNPEKKGETGVVGGGEGVGSVVLHWNPR